MQALVQLQQMTALQGDSSGTAANDGACQRQPTKRQIPHMCQQQLTRVGMLWWLQLQMRPVNLLTRLVLHAVQGKRLPGTRAQTLVTSHMVAGGSGGSSSTATNGSSGGQHNSTDQHGPGRDHKSCNNGDDSSSSSRVNDSSRGRVIATTMGAVIMMAAAASRLVANTAGSSGHADINHGPMMPTSAELEQLDQAAEQLSPVAGLNEGPPSCCMGTPWLKLIHQLKMCLLVSAAQVRHMPGITITSTLRVMKCCAVSATFVPQHFTPNEQACSACLVNCPTHHASSVLQDVLYSCPQQGSQDSQMGHGGSRKVCPYINPRLSAMAWLLQLHLAARTAHSRCQ
eukprot:GHRR01014089.1.p1 GENE.GHRR01014089.1~~GHRR01014089.1.p1  ORF type:complete len:342 (+),score=132.98 GHRR01014089.1:1487-2512(+)